MTARDEEVWLRGNVRPASLLVAVALFTGTALAALAAAPEMAAVMRPLALGYWLCVGPLAVVLALEAWQPRLSRRGDHLRVRLAPLRADDVPLEFVECFFLGSEQMPDPRARDDLPGQRVNTLVVRIAERAEAWHARPAFAAWGRWTDGAVVLDGRWCEPLSPELARRLTARLVAARREIAARTAAAPHGGAEPRG